MRKLHTKTIGHSHLVTELQDIVLWGGAPEVRVWHAEMRPSTHGTLMFNIAVAKLLCPQSSQGCRCSTIFGVTVTRTAPQLPRPNCLGSRCHFFSKRLELKRVVRRRGRILDFAPLTFAQTDPR